MAGAVQSLRERAIARVSVLICAFAFSAGTLAAALPSTARAAAQTSTTGTRVLGPGTATSSVATTRTSTAPASIGSSGTAGAGVGGGAGTTTYVPGGASTLPGIATSTTPNATPGSRLPTLGLGNGAPLTRGLVRPRTQRAHRGIGAWEIALIAAAAVLLLGLAAWAAVRRRARDPHWWLALRHSFAEAGFRASETWAEFADWARLGH